MKVVHMQIIKKSLLNSKEVWKTRWSTSGIVVGPWVLQAILWVVLVRSTTYGLELIMLANNPVSQVMAFAGVLGLPVWGWLILSGVVITVLGICTRNLLIVTLGTLMSFGVWIAFSGVVAVGAFTAAAGIRFAVNALCTAGVWLTIFILHLNAIKRVGVTA